MSKKNEEFINRHVVGICSKCDEKFYGSDVYISITACSTGKPKLKCSCGNVDEWMNYRNYQR